MTERRRILIVSMLTLACVTVLVSTSIVFILYRTALQQQRERLRESIHGQARLIEAVARFDSVYSVNDHRDGAHAATLDQIIDSHKHFEGFSKTGEFTMAKRQGDQIVFLLDHSEHSDYDYLQPVPWRSQAAEPMRRALSGQSGTCVAYNSGGHLVLSAYEPVQGLEVGLVSKIDLAEIRAPFIFAGALACAITIMGVITGSIIIYRFTGPLVMRMKQAEQHTQAILDHADEIIITLDDQGVIQSFNHKAQNLFGYRPGEAIGQNVDLLIYPPGQDEVEGYARRLIKKCRSDPDFHDREIEVKRKDGSAFPVHLAVSEVTGIDGQLCVAIMHDLTDEKALRAQLGHAQKMESIGQLAAGIAHEINTPIQYVNDNTRFVQENLEGLLTLIDRYDRQLNMDSKSQSWQGRAEEIRELSEALDIGFLKEEIPKAIEQTLEGVGCVSEIVRAMKGFSHPGAKSRSAADLNGAIENTITVCRNRWKYVADLETNLAPDLPMVSCLVGEFNQVILNLIVNAADAISEVIEGESGDKGVITITTREDGGWVEILLEDTGGGIPDTIKDRIFDPFFTTKEVGKGSGQGLTICHDVIVNKHGGEIDIQTTPGKGTTFILRLPVSQGELQKGAA